MKLMLNILTKICINRKSFLSVAFLNTVLFKQSVSKNGEQLLGIQKLMYYKNTYLTNYVFKYYIYKVLQQDK
jgi:hypothetical protein